LVGDEDPCSVDLLGGEGVDGAFVAVAGAVVVVDDVAIGGEDGDIAGKKACTVNAAFETAVACPYREDDVVAVDNFLPAAFELAVGDDVVGIWGEALGIGG